MKVSSENRARPADAEVCNGLRDERHGPSQPSLPSADCTLSTSSASAVRYAKSLAPRKSGIATDQLEGQELPEQLGAHRWWISKGDQTPRRQHTNNNGRRDTTEVG